MDRSLSRILRLALGQDEEPMRLGRKKPSAKQILSRVQDTSRIPRGFRQPSAPQVDLAARATGLEVYDGVEAANQAGLPMPGQF